MFYELVLFMTYYGQQCVNVFNYVMTGTPAVVTGSFGLASAFGALPITLGEFPVDTMMGEIQGQLSDQLTFNQIRVKNVYDTLDFYSVPFPAGIVGSQGGEAASPAVAYSLRSNQTRLDIQAGQKRFPGVTETHMQPGGLLSSGMVTALTGLADIMSAPLEYTDEGNDLSYQLVVAKKFTDLEAEPPIKNAYWPTEAEQLDNVAASLTWTVRPYVSTQTTRQYGHGR